MFTAIIIDDEQNSSEFLNNLLKRYFSSTFHVYGTAVGVAEGVELIHQYNPDIVFLDIEMPHENGFKLFEYFNGDYTFEVVFTTAHEEYAIKAIKNEAFDYLLKPVDQTDVLSLIKRLEKKQKEKTNNDLSIFTVNKNNSRKIPLPSQYGTFYMDESFFLYAKAAGAYCEINLIDGRKVILSKSLGDFEEMTTDFNFFRTHKSYIINLDYVGELVKKDGYQIIMKNNFTIPLSTRRRDEFITKI